MDQWQLSKTLRTESIDHRQLLETPSWEARISVNHGKHLV